MARSSSHTAGSSSPPTRPDQSVTARFCGRIRLGWRALARGVRGAGLRRPLDGRSVSCWFAGGAGLARREPRTPLDPCAARRGGGSWGNQGFPPRCYIIPPMSGMPAGSGRGLLGRLGDDRLGGEDVLRDRRGVLQRRARHHRRVDDPRLDEVLDLAAVDVQAEALLRRADLVDDDRALEARVVGELAERLLERAEDDRRTGLLVALERLEALLRRVRRVQERDAAAGDDALLERGAGRLQGVLDAVLLLLHLGLGRSADLDHRDAARQLREALLELLAVEVGVRRSRPPTSAA